MFTGIIQSIGKIAKLQKTSTGLNITVDCGALSNKIAVSDSVAVNGICLTVTNISGQNVQFDVVKETISKTNLSKLRTGEKVNLEPAIRAGEPFGGHFVQGHIDGIGAITKKGKTAGGYIMEIKASPELTGQMIHKGSIAIDGISLTIMGLKKDRFTVALIPYTLKYTNLGNKPIGAIVNLEADLIGKWIRKSVESKSSSKSSRLLIDLL
jgi:riboflavin synthase